MSCSDKYTYHRPTEEELEKGFSSYFSFLVFNKKRNFQKEVLVDEEDYNKIKDINWAPTSTLKHAIGCVDGKLIQMHEYLCRNEIDPEKPLVDHRYYRNGFDNRYQNLRRANYRQNKQNAQKKENCKSKYRGVSYKKENQKWEVSFLGQYYGLYKEEQEAGWAYNIAVSVEDPEMTINQNINLSNEVQNNIKEKVEQIIQNRSNPVQRNLPKNILFHKNRYTVTINKKYIGGFKTLDQAIQVKNQELQRLEQIKQLKAEERKNQEILRNNKGIAIIKVKKNDNVYEVLVSDSHWHALMEYQWIYFGDYIWCSKLNQRMHRYVFQLKYGRNPKKGYVVDHFNREKLDHRSENIFERHPSFNAHNRKKADNCSSKYFGVSYIQKQGWRAQINYNKKPYMKICKTELEAAKEYNKMVSRFYPDSCRINIITENMFNNGQ